MCKRKHWLNIGGARSMANPQFKLLGEQEGSSLEAYGIKEVYANVPYMCEQVAQKAKRTWVKPVTSRSPVLHTNHYSLQAGRHDIKLSVWSSSAVLGLSLSYGLMATPLIYQPTTLDCTLLCLQDELSLLLDCPCEFFTCLFDRSSSSLEDVFIRIV